MIFYATFEQPGEDNTKVHANENLYLRWNADDRVSIFNKNTYNQQYQFTGKTGANAGSFKKLDSEDEFITGNAINHVVSVYPYQESAVISERDEALSLTLPEIQHYSENTFGLGANTMVSVSTDNVLQYKNVGGYLKLSLYGEGVTVSLISLRGNNCETLAGKATVTMPLDGEPSIVLNDFVRSEILLVCDTPVALGATAEESKDFWFVVPPVTFSQGFTISVVETTGGTFKKSTTKSITIERSMVSKMAVMEVEEMAPGNPVPEAIDLGLSVKWASFNLGASKPEDFGDYYAWGETEPYYEPGYAQSESPVWKPGKEAGYDLPSYKWSVESQFIKYCPDMNFGYNGCTDTKTILDPEEDAAHKAFGGNWRMPTRAEMEELWNCSMRWETMNGIPGFTVIGRNGNTIFLPWSGFRDGTRFSPHYERFYWTSSLYVDYPAGAYSFNDQVDRDYGLTIRPVFVEYDPVESVILNKTNLEIGIGKEVTLLASVLPESACQYVSWSSSNKSVASVSSTGVVTGEAAGTAVITATAEDGTKSATCEVTVSRSVVPLPDAVDLGLSVKWAAFNLGASEPFEYGDYYAWGEITPHYLRQNPLIWEKGKEDGYELSTYKWYTKPGLNKYCWNASEGYHGFTDDKYILDPEDDAVHMSLGGKWRMPTAAEVTELTKQCTWEKTTQNGMEGLKMTGPNGNSIFLPAAGYYDGNTLFSAGPFGGYWSSSLQTEWNSIDALPLSFEQDQVNPCEGLPFFSFSRVLGFSIRPVLPNSVESIRLNKTSMELGLGRTTLLEATILPMNATDKDVSWSSSDESIATVSPTGIVKAIALGTTVITVMSRDEGKTASCEVTVNDSTIPDAIDLGLSVKWASFNLGAANPEEFGDYYAWGETTPYYDVKDPLVWKEDKELGYDWGSYKWSMDSYKMLTKYCYDPSYGYNGFTDAKTILDPEDDAAHVFLGDKWRTPTSTELAELAEQCTWVWTTENGINGQRVTGPNGNSIFLPATGYYYGNDSTNDVGANGQYWSSSLSSDDSPSSYDLYFYSGSTSIGADQRSAGHTIRPIYGDFITVESVSVRSTLEVGIGQQRTLQAAILPENASDKVIFWSSSDESIATVSPSGVVRGIAIGSVVITATAKSGGKKATCQVVVSEATVPVPDEIDLGLSVKWASFNLGASEPEGYGYYYAWGEIEPYYYNWRWGEGKEAGYDWPSYKWCMGAGDTMIKYCPISSYGYNGFTDDKSVLDPEDDAAYVALCGKWRMPTEAELTELRTQCSWEWTTMNGINGRKVTGPNGNSIFLPAAGRYQGTSRGSLGSTGYYWSSSLNKSNPLNAFEIYFNSSYMYSSNSARYMGRSIRPVTD